MRHLTCPDCGVLGSMADLGKEVICKECGWSDLEEANYGVSIEYMLETKENWDEKRS